MWVNKRIHIEIWDNFWWLTVIWFDTDIKNWVICRCKCWTQKTINKYSLSKWTKTCGCWWYYKKNSRYIWDWIFDTKSKEEDKRFHSIYLWITRRCWKEWPWKDVLNKWNNFKDFYNDMYDSYISHINTYWVKQTTIDRIDPYWNYCKDNCRRATYSEQLSNRRGLDHYVIWWKKYRLSELKEITWLTESKIIRRYKRYLDGKMSEDKMLFNWKLKWNKFCKKTFI